MQALDSIGEISASSNKHHEVIERAREYLILHGYEIGQAIDLLLNEKTVSEIGSA